MFRSHLLSIVVIFVVIVCWTFSASGILGHPMSDMPDHFWGNNWFAEQITNGILPIQTQDTHYPEGGTLWHIDPIGGIIRLLLWTLSPHHSWNMGVAIQLTALGSIMYGFSNYCLRDKLVSLWVSFALVFSSYTMGLIHSGLTEYLGVGWIIGLLWALKSNFKWPIGILLGLCFWQTPVYGVLGALLCLFTLWKQPLHLLKTAGISLLVSFPAILGIFNSLRNSPAFLPSEAPGWTPMNLPSIDILGWFHPGFWLHPDTVSFGNDGILQSHSFAISGFIALSWGVYKSQDCRAWLYKHLWISLLMLGPRLCINRWTPLSGAFFLPMALFYLPFMPTKEFHHPYHVAALALPILLLAAGYGLKSMSRKFQVILFVAYLLETAMAPGGLFPSRTPIPQPTQIEGPRLDWPADMHIPNRMYLLAQPYHGQPIASGVNRWLSPCLLETKEIHDALMALEDPIWRSINRDQPPRFKQGQRPTASIKNCGLEWVVLHRNYLSEDELRKTRTIFEHLFSEPTIETKGELVYSLTNETER